MENKGSFALAIVLVVMATLARLVPHAWNFTPITAILLFSAFAFKSYWKIAVPMAAIVFSDIALEITQGIGFHEGTWVIYLAFTLILCLGFISLKRAGLIRVAGVSLLASSLFFLVTNFALFYPTVTQAGQLQGYPHTIQGIIGSYTAGLPFFRNMLIGDLICTVSLFAVYQFVSQRFLKPQLTK